MELISLYYPNRFPALYCRRHFRMVNATFFVSKSGFYVPFEYGEDVPRPGGVIPIGAMMGLDSSQPPVE